MMNADLPVLGDEVPVDIMPVLYVSRQNEISGTYTTQGSLPDTGTTYQLNGRGNYRHLGAVSVAGSFATPGFIRNNRLRGTLTITGQGENDQMTLSIVSNQNPALHTGGSLFHFKVQNATGKFKHVVSSGTLQLKLVPTATNSAIHAAEDVPVDIVTIGGSLQASGSFTIRFRQTKS